MKLLCLCAIIFYLALPAAGQSALSTPPSWQAEADSAKKDTLAVSPGSQNPAEKDKIKIVKRKIDYRNFVVLAIGMMVYVALILGTTQAWNPGGRTP
jgi:anthranilate/para-aminobenzoate synthase component II